MEKIAVIMTVFNRKEKTLRCLNSLCRSWAEAKSPIQYEVFLTDDGCTDGTKEAVMALGYQFPIHIIEGTGNLFWLGGMNLAWRAAINQSGFDGYLWLNDDTIVLADFWIELLATQQYAQSHYGIGGIYVGSTCDPSTKQFTYGGFDFINKWTLKDQFIIPNGQDIKPCECAHGNITYVSNEVVSRLGVFHEKCTYHRQVCIWTDSFFVVPHSVFTFEAAACFIQRVGSFTFQKIIHHIFREVRKHLQQIGFHDLFLYEISCNHTLGQ